MLFLQAQAIEKKEKKRRGRRGPTSQSDRSTAAARELIGGCGPGPGGGGYAPMMSCLLGLGPLLRKASLMGSTDAAEEASTKEVENSLQQDRSLT